MPATPARVLPDIAAPLTLETIYGTDKNWDEPREGWLNLWPEGGNYSTAGDLLRFLRFIRTGKAPDGRVLLNDESLRLITSFHDGLSPRTFAFGGGGASGVLGNNGYFGTVIRRDTNRCYNATVLMQMITESPEGAPHRVQLCDYQFGDIMFLRGKILAMLDGIPSACDAASPLEP